MGLSIDVVDFTVLDKSQHSILLSVDTERPRNFAEQAKVGIEYTLMKTLALRGGYTYPTDEQGITLGIGLRRALGNIGFGIDYAYTSFGVFDYVNRLGVELSFGE